MYGNLAGGISDFVISFDDFLLAEVISSKQIKKWSAEDYGIARAKLRSEIIYSPKVHEVVSKKIDSIIEKVKGLPDIIGGDFGFGLGSMHSAGNLAADFANPSLRRGGFGGGFGNNFGLASGNYMGGGFATFFDTILLDKYLPVKVAASLTSAQQQAISALIKLELFNSDAVKKTAASVVKEVL